jgi:hypothetical protein
MPDSARRPLLAVSATLGRVAVCYRVRHVLPGRRWARVTWRAKRTFEKERPRLSSSGHDRSVRFSSLDSISAVGFRGIGSPISSLDKRLEIVRLLQTESRSHSIAHEWRGASQSDPGLLGVKKHQSRSRLAELICRNPVTVARELPPTPCCSFCQSASFGTEMGSSFFFFNKAFTPGN